MSSPLSSHLSSSSTPLHSTSSSQTSSWQLRSSPYFQLQTLQQPIPQHQFNSRIYAHSEEIPTSTSTGMTGTSVRQPIRQDVIQSRIISPRVSRYSGETTLSPIAGGAISHSLPSTSSSSSNRRRSRADRDSDSGPDSDSSDQYSGADSENESLLIFPRSPRSTRHKRTKLQDQQGKPDVSLKHSLVVRVPAQEISQVPTPTPASSTALADQLYPPFHLNDIPGLQTPPPPPPFSGMRRRGSAPFPIPQFSNGSATSSTSTGSPPPQLQRTISHTPVRLSPPIIHRSKSLLHTHTASRSSNSSQYLLPPVATPPSPARAPLPSPLTNEEAAIDALFSRLAMSDRLTPSPLFRPLHRRSSSSSLPSPLSSSPFNSPTASPTPSGLDSDMKEEDDDFPSTQWFVRVDGVEDEMDASNASDGRMGQQSAVINAGNEETKQLPGPSSPNPNDLLMGESMRSFFTSLSLAPDDWITLALAWKWQCSIGGVIRRNEFIAGMKSMECQSISDLQTAIKKLREELLSSLPSYRIFYTFVFHFIRVRPSQKHRRTIGMRQAIPLLLSLLRERYEKSIVPLCDYFSHLAYVKKKKNTLTLEEWLKILDWCILNEEKPKNSAGEKGDVGNNWPQLLIDYMKWRKEQGNNTNGSFNLGKLEKVREGNGFDTNHGKVGEYSLSSDSIRARGSPGVSAVASTAANSEPSYQSLSPPPPTEMYNSTSHSHIYRLTRPFPLSNGISNGDVAAPSQIISEGINVNCSSNHSAIVSDQSSRKNSPIPMTRTTSIDMVD